jgi:hypothetical protein
MNIDIKRYTADCNVKAMVPGSHLPYQASDVTWPGGQSIPEQERDRLFHNVLKGALQRQFLERQKWT